MTATTLTLDMLPLDQLTPADVNPKGHAADLLDGSLAAHGFVEPLVVDERTSRLLHGHGRREQLLAWRDAGREPPAGIGVDADGQWLVPVVRGVQSSSDADAHALGLALNATTMAGGWDEPDLEALLSQLQDRDVGLAGTGFTPTDLTDLQDRLGMTAGLPTGSMSDDAEQPEVARLVDLFVAPPFSVLDARQGYWRDRKRQWQGLGIQSEVGRAGNVLGMDGAVERREAIRGGTAFHQASLDQLGAKVKEQRTLAQGLDAHRADDGTLDYTETTGGGVSIFDPVLCELAYRWWSPPGGTVLDPFAGGSVRGLVAAALGRRYTGVDLSAVQVHANAAQVRPVLGQLDVPDLPPDQPLPDHQPPSTPWHASAHLAAAAGGPVWVARDDWWQAAGHAGGKVRTCQRILQDGLAAGATVAVTAGSRHSPQVAMTAALAARLGLDCHVHVPAGDDTPQVAAAAAAGATVHRHRPGHNTVIVARARAHAADLGDQAVHVPFGMEHQSAVDLTAASAQDTLHQLQAVDGVARLVVAVGSGMTLAGLLHTDMDLPVLGVVVGADPRDRLDRWAPDGWRDRVTLVDATVDYAAAVDAMVEAGQPLDPHYEAKVVEHLQPGDVLWVVGHRDATAVRPPHLWDDQRTWTTSAAWLAKPWDCTLAGITREGGCGGGCCTSPTFWPPKAGESAAGCDQLGPDGCTMTEQQRPVKCLLYPLLENKSGKLVAHGRAPMGVCKPVSLGNAPDGAPQLSEAMHSNLAEVLGADQADQVSADTAQGVDSVVAVPALTNYWLHVETVWEAQDMVPVDRTVHGLVDPSTPDVPADQPAQQGPVQWVVGDATALPAAVTDQAPYAMLFSCPPYADLERYSDDPADLSTMDYPAFLPAYRQAIAQAVTLLDTDAFAVWVVGEVRSTTGGYHGLVPDTIRAFTDAGMTYYNEAVLVTPAGSLPLRVRRPFMGSRKVGKSHQNVLVFVKGDPVRAAARCTDTEGPALDLPPVAP